ncbi:MAG: transporter substrate-binding domain-containing protein [Dehalococcoidia bacterium]|nr:transporter substrate-binding domain-containing protein [Dehalococcoidia bacterium]
MRVGAVLVALALALVLACGGEEGSTASPPSPAAQTPAAQEPGPSAAAAQPEQAAPQAQPETQQPPGEGATETPAPTEPEDEEGLSKELLRIEFPFLRIAVPKVGVPAASIYMAKRGGFFESIGLDVTLVEVPDFETALAALQAGDVHLAILSLPEAARGAASSRPVQAIGSVLGSHPYNLVVAAPVAREKGLTSTSILSERLAMMRGLRIGVPKERLAQATTSELVKAAGLSEQDVSLVSLSSEELLTALRTGQVDALLATHPVLERAILTEGAAMLVNLSRGEVNALEPFPWLVLATTEVFQSLTQDTLVAAVYAVWNAARQIRTQVERSQELLAPDFPALSQEEYEKAVSIYFPAVPNNPLLTPLSYSKVFRVLGETPPPYLDVVDMRYVEALIPRR